MSSSTSSRDGRTQAAFLNRTAELGVVRASIDRLTADPSVFVVFEVVGLGGVGKTRLLNEIRLRTEAHDLDHEILWISLAAEAAVPSVGPLRALRGQLSFNCLLFDTALLSYWVATGQPIEANPTRGKAANVVMRTVETGGGFFGVPLPVTFARDIAKGVGRSVVKHRRYENDEFEAIDDLRRDPETLLRNLPSYLALDMTRALTGQDTRLVFFWDAYEKQSIPTLAGKARWQQDLIKGLSRGVHIVSTRDPIGWDETAWKNVLHRIDIHGLAPGQSKQMIAARLGEVSSAVEEKLLSSSSGIPFFLEAAIAVAVQMRNDGHDLESADLPSSQPAVVERLLNHLGDDERTLALVLASIQNFDLDLFADVVRSLNLPITLTAFQDFLDWFFVSENENGLYAVHDVLTKCVRESAEHRAATSAALAAAARHLSRSTADDPVRDAIILRSVLEGWSAVGDMPQEAVETILDVGYQLYDAGHWSLLEALPDLDNPEPSTGPALVATFLRSLVDRRLRGPNAALKVLDTIEPHRLNLGRHAVSFDLEAGYLSEITGNYERAREQFRELSDRAQPFDSTSRVHLRSRLYHADMLLMDGRFVESSRLLLDGYEEIGTTSILDWAEYVRHRAHAHRFSWMLEEAERLYRTALNAVEHAPAMRGKLLTNLVETLCWVDAEAALTHAELAISVHADLGNTLEIAKCDAATAIAHARLREFETAASLAERSRVESQAVGYPAGTAFALQAAAIVAAFAGDDSTARERLGALLRSTGSLGTYGHLCAAPAWLLGDDQVFVESALEVDWIDAAGLEARLGSLRL